MFMPILPAELVLDAWLPGSGHIATADWNIGKVVFPRSSASIILMTNRHRLRVANGYIWRGMQNTDRLWKSIVGCATA